MSTAALASVLPSGAPPLRRLFLLSGPKTASAPTTVSKMLDADLLAIPVEVEFLSVESVNAEEIADACIRAIRAIQPVGPYLLAGCGGAGLIAVEAASQLIGADQDVHFLGLLNSAPRRNPGQDGVVEFTDAHVEGGRPLPRSQLHYVLPPLPATLTLFVDANVQGETLIRSWTSRLGGRTRLHTVLCNVADVVALREAGPLLEAITTQPDSTSEQARERRYAPIHTIQGGRSAAVPVFIVPGAGASVTGLIHLAQALGDIRPIYGLQPRGLCGELVPHSDVPHTAQHYVNALRTLVPSGPFHLAGHSYGGWVALEMARQMEALGRPPASLFMLDSRPPADSGTRRAFHSPEQALEHLVDLYNLHVSQPITLRAAHFEPLSEHDQLRLLLGELIRVKLFPPRAGIDMLRGIVRVFRTNLNTSYELTQPYSGPVNLVLADGGDDREDIAGNWRRHAPNTRSFFSDGNHITLLSPPFVHALGAYIQDVFLAVEAGGTGYLDSASSRVNTRHAPR